MTVRRHFTKRAAHRGFSLIELLMVISIITLITSIIVASMVTSREKARVANAKVEMRQIVEVALVATGEEGKTVIGITDTTQGHLAPNEIGEECLNSGEIAPDSGGGPCYDAWKHMAMTLGSKSGGLTAADSFFISFMFDPWGVPYIIYERQGIYGEVDTCDDQDQVASAGRDRTHGTDDDVLMNIPLSPICP